MDEATERAYADFTQLGARLTGLRRDLADTRTVVTSRDRGLTVTADATGAIVEIRFLTQAYRSMAGAELAALLVKTMSAAREQAGSAVIQSFQELLPDLPIADIVAGVADPVETVRGLTYDGDA